MLKELLGPGLVLVFAVSQAFRDVYFANVFQGIDFFLVIALAFFISTVIFAIVILGAAKAETAMRKRSAMVFINHGRSGNRGCARCS